LRWFNCCVFPQVRWLHRHKLLHQGKVLGTGEHRLQQQQQQTNDSAATKPSLCLSQAPALSLLLLLCIQHHLAVRSMLQVG
jgi:hypothetical protein